MKKLLFTCFIICLSLNLPAQTIGFGIKCTPDDSFGQSEMVRSAEISVLVGKHLTFSVSNGSAKFWNYANLPETAIVDISSVGVGYRVNLANCYIGPTIDYVRMTRVSTGTSDRTTGVQYGMVVGVLTDSGCSFQVKMTKKDTSFGIFLHF